MWECPITTYMSEIINQQMVERENAITLKVSETIGVDVNREELIKALNYDRHQYEKGYADAKAEFTPKWTRVEDGLPEESGLYLILCREENTLHDTVEFNPYLDMYYPNSNPTSWERWSNDYYDKSKVVAWMPIPKYEEG